VLAGASRTRISGGSQGTRRSKGLPQSKHVYTFNALTCELAPLAGLEPATYGLEVSLRSSTW
jgi:hypothetical protein